MNEKYFVIDDLNKWAVHEPPKEYIGGRVMEHVELFRRVSGGNYKPLLKLDEFELIRFVAYLVQRIKATENKNHTD